MKHSTGPYALWANCYVRHSIMKSITLWYEVWKVWKDWGIYRPLGHLLDSSVAGNAVALTDVLPGLGHLCLVCHGPWLNWWGTVSISVQIVKLVGLGLVVKFYRLKVRFTRQQFNNFIKKTWDCRTQNVVHSHKAQFVKFYSHATSLGPIAKLFLCEAIRPTCR